MTSVFSPALISYFFIRRYLPIGPTYTCRKVNRVGRIEMHDRIAVLKNNNCAFNCPENIIEPKELEHLYLIESSSFTPPNNVIIT